MDGGGSFDRGRDFFILLGVAEQELRESENLSVLSRLRSPVP